MNIHFINNKYQNNEKIQNIIIIAIWKKYYHLSKYYIIKYKNDIKMKNKYEKLNLINHLDIKIRNRIKQYFIFNEFKAIFRQENAYKL